MTAFIFKDRYEFDWEVKVEIPAGSGFDTQIFTGSFLMPPETEIFAAGEAETVEARLGEDIARLSQWFVGWRGIERPDGTELPVTDENKRALLAIRPVRMAVIRAFNEAVVFGGTRAKNSGPLHS